MKVSPKTDKEIAEMNLWPVGEYGFQILEKTNFGGKEYATCDRISSKENEMIQLVVQVYNETGQFKIILDYLVDSMFGKVKNSASACGLIKNYEAGELRAADFIGKTGNLKLKIDKDKTGQYADKNVIADYLSKGADAFVPPKGHPASNAPAYDDDEIPF